MDFVFVTEPDHKGMLVNWLRARIPYFPAPRYPDTFQAAAMLSGDRIAAACCYHNHADSLKHIECTFAADNPMWCRPGNVEKFFAYPFKQLGVERITLMIARKNKRARKVAKKIGFREEGIARKGFYPDDAVLYGLLRTDEAAKRYIGG